MTATYGTLFAEFLSTHQIIVGAVSITLGMLLLNWINTIYSNVLSPYIRGWYGLNEWTKLRSNYYGVPVEWNKFLDDSLLYIFGIVVVFGIYYKLVMTANNFEPMSTIEPSSKKTTVTNDTNMKELPPTMHIEKKPTEQENVVYNPTESISVEPMWSAAFGNFSPMAASV